MSEEKQLSLDEVIDAINAAVEQGDTNARKRNTSQRIADELRILQSMLQTETGLRDKLVELGQNEGFKTVRMKYFEEQIAWLLKLQNQQGGAS